MAISGITGSNVPNSENILGGKITVLGQCANFRNFCLFPFL